MANKNLNEVLGKDIQSVKDLRAAIKEYQDALVGADAESQEYKDTTDKLAVAQDELKNVTKAGKEGVIQYSDSIAGLEKQYREMYNAYRQMSEEMRNSDAGKKQAEELNALSEKLNNLKKDVGNYKDNIGRYAESVLDAFSKMGGSVGQLVGPFKTATQGITAFNTALKSNPVGAVITLVMALVNVIKQLSASIKGNEESQMRLNQAMASFRPIMDAAKNAMDKVGKVIVSIVEGLAKFYDKLRTLKAGLTDFIKGNNDATKALENQKKAYQELAKAQNDYIIKHREIDLLNAKENNKVEALREEASETENVQDKIHLLEQAKEIQAGIDQRNIEMAEENVRILQEEAEKTANDTAAQDALNQAMIDLENTRAQASANARRYNREIKAATSSTKSAADAMKNLKEEAKKIFEETVENSKTEITKVTEKYEKEKKLLQKYHYDTTELTKQYNKNVQALRRQEREKELSQMQEQFTFITNVWREQQKSLGKTDEEITAYITSQSLTFYNVLAEKINAIMSDTKTTMDEKLKQIGDEVEVINQYGLDIDFPPETWPAGVEDKLGLVIAYIQAFGKNLKTELDNANKVVKDNSLTKAFEEANKNIDTKVNFKVEFNIEELLRSFEEGISEQGFADLIDKQTRETLEVEKAAIEQELENFGGSYEQRLEILERYYAVVAELRQMDWDDEKKAMDKRMAQLDYYQNVSSNFSQSLVDSSAGIINLANGFKTLYNAQIQEGKLNEKEVKAKKKRMEDLEKVVLAATIAQIVASTAQGMVDTWTGYIKETSVVNPQTAAAAGFGSAAALGVLNAASLAKAIGKSVGLATTAAGQIAAARGGYISNVTSLRDEGSGGGASVAAPSEMETNPYSYSRTLQTAEEEDKLNRPIYVSVVDIIDAENKVRVTEDDNSF